MSADFETRFKRAMANLAAPVSIITTGNESDPHATTVSAIASLSLNPTQVLFALNHRSQLLAKLESQSRCGVNLLARGQAHIALACARSGPDRLADVDWYMSDGVPRIAGILVWMRCDVVSTITSGDHAIVVAQPTVIEVDETAQPCVYFRREFHTVAGSAA